MTLRVEVSIIPFGNENEKRVIETLNISNVHHCGDDIYEYAVEHNAYKIYDRKTPLVYHKRRDGALKLVHKALDKLVGHE